MAILEVEHINKKFDRTEVLKDISFSLEQGQVLSIIGSSGSGKTTLLRHLKKELLPKGKRSGKVLYDGQEIEQLQDLQSVKEVGYLFQNPSAQMVMDTVWHEIAFGLENLRMPYEQMKRTVAEIVNYFDLQKIYHEDTDKLSGGQKQLVNLAAVMAMHPKVLILDEPTAGLDPAGRDEILDLIARMHKEKGITVILVSHSMEDIAKYAERLIVVNDGEIAYDDAPKAVFAHYRELEAMGLAAPQITYIMHALKEKGLDVDVTATTVDEAKENILAVLRKCNLGKLSGNRQSVSDSQSKKENAKAETLISEMEADLTKDGTKESHSDVPDEDLSIQKETMDKKSAEQEENEGGQEV